MRSDMNTLRERAEIDAEAVWLAGEVRRLRLHYAARIRRLHDLGRRTGDRLRTATDAREIDRCQRLVARLPDVTRRLWATYNLLAFAPAAERVRYLLSPGERAGMREEALLAGVRCDDGAAVEVME
jgi:hypothetical protein